MTCSASVLQRSNVEPVNPAKMSCVIVTDLAWSNNLLIKNEENSYGSFNGKHSKIQTKGLWNPVAVRNVIEFNRIRRAHSHLYSNVPSYLDCRTRLHANSRYWLLETRPQSALYCSSLVPDCWCYYCLGCTNSDWPAERDGCLWIVILVGFPWPLIVVIVVIAGPK